MIKVFIADDHDILREGIKQILADHGDIVVGGEAQDGTGTLAGLRAQACDLVLLDMAMPGRSGIELIKEIREEFPGVPVLVLSMYKEDQFAVRALKAGAAGYLCKDSAATQLVPAIRKVAGGGLFINPAVTDSLAGAVTGGGEPHHNRLTDREFQIFRLLAAGHSVGEIARQLALSIKTVSTHKARILDKMQFSNMSELVRYAVKHRFISGETGIRD